MSYPAGTPSFSPKQGSGSSSIPSSPRISPSSSFKRETRPRSYILDPNSSKYRYSLHSASVPRFPDGTHQPRPAAPTAHGRRSSAEKSGRLVTEIDSPSPSEPPSRPVSRAGSGSRQMSMTGGDRDRDCDRASTLTIPMPASRPNSTIFTSFPFPHPTTPARLGPDPTQRRSLMGYVGNWIHKGTNLFAGPYERSLMEQEREDDEILRGIIVAHLESEPRVRSYGAIGESKPAAREHDPNDPYGYRRLAGPALLPSYNADADLATRRRERRRARSRARFQCMALWTIWTVCIVLLLLILGSGASIWKEWRDGRLIPAIA